MFLIDKMDYYPLNISLVSLLYVRLIETAAKMRARKAVARKDMRIVGRLSERVLNIIKSFNGVSKIVMMIATPIP